MNLGDHHGESDGRSPRLAKASPLELSGVVRPAMAVPQEYSQLSHVQLLAPAQNTWLQVLALAQTQNLQLTLMSRYLERKKF